MCSASVPGTNRPWHSTAHHRTLEPRTGSPARRLAVFVHSRGYTLLWLQHALEQSGYRIATLSPSKVGTKGIRQLQRRGLQLLVIVDTDSEALRRQRLCRRIRQQTLAPIVLFVDNGHPNDIVAGIEQGADLVLCTPIDIREALARIQVLIRRAYNVDSSPGLVDMFQYSQELHLSRGNMELDTVEHMALIDGRQIHLTALESRLLQYFMEHPNQILSKQDLLRHVWNTEDPSRSNLAEVAIRRLRAKIEEDPSRPKRLITIHRVGYMLNVHM